MTSTRDVNVNQFVARTNGGAFSTKLFSNVHLKFSGTSEITAGVSTIDCRSCIVTVTGSLEVRSRAWNFTATSRSSVPANIINQGSMVFVVDSVGMNIHGNITNSGTITVVPDSYSNISRSSSFTVHGNLANEAGASFSSYFTNITLSILYPQTQWLGSWYVWASPGSALPDGSASLQWWLNIVPPIESLWNFHRRVFFSIQPVNQDNQYLLTMQNFTGYGPVTFEVVMPTSGVGINLFGAVELDTHGTVKLRSGNSTLANGKFALQARSSFSTGYLLIGQTWVVDMTGSSLTVYRQCVVQGRLQDSFTVSGFKNAERDRLDFGGFAHIPTGGELNVVEATITFEHVLLDGGLLEFTNTDVTCNGSFFWQGGTMRSYNGGFIDLQQGAKLLRNTNKELQAGIRLKGAPVYTSTLGNRGAFSEYFQYRRKTPPLINARGFYSPSPQTGEVRVPQSFDDPSTMADFSELQPVFRRESQIFGLAPIVLDAEGNPIEDNDLSYTYDYAVRLTTNRFIDASGNYVFNVSWSCSFIRVWINNKVIIAYCADGTKDVVGKTCPQQVPDGLITRSFTTNLVGFTNHVIRVDLFRLRPTQGSPAFDYSFTMTLVTPLQGSPPVSTAYKLVSPWVRSCYTNGSRYPENFKVRHPASVCDTALSTSELCKPGRGVSCLIVPSAFSGGKLRVGNGGFINATSTGVIWITTHGSLTRTATSTVMNVAGLVTCENTAYNSWYSLDQNGCSTTTSTQSVPYSRE